MPDFDTRQVRDDDARWDARAVQVARAAALASRRPGLDFLGHARAAGIAASLAAAAAVVILAMPRPQAAAADFGTQLTAAIGPTDATGQAMATSPAPPSVGALLLGGAR